MNVSFPSLLDDSTTENVAEGAGFGSEALGASEVWPMTFAHPYIQLVSLSNV